jgi:hypothetical protein
MIIPHLVEVAMEFNRRRPREYRARQAASEQAAAKGEILLAKVEPIALSFDPRAATKHPCAVRKTTDRPDIAAYDPHQAGPWGCYTGEP